MKMVEKVIAMSILLISSAAFAGPRDVGSVGFNSTSILILDDARSAFGYLVQEGNQLVVERRTQDYVGRAKAILNEPTLFKDKIEPVYEEVTDVTVVQNEHMKCALIKTLKVTPNTGTLAQKDLKDGDGVKVVISGDWITTDFAVVLDQYICERK